MRLRFFEEKRLVELSRGKATGCHPSVNILIKKTKAIKT